MTYDDISKEEFYRDYPNEELLKKTIITTYLTEKLKQTTYTNSKNPKQTYWKRETLKQLLKEIK